jgi:ribonuclease HI
MLSYRKHAENRAHALTLGIGVLRKARKNTSDSLGATSLAERDPELLLAYEADVSSHSTTFPKVQQFVKAAFAENPLIDPIRLAKPNFLRSAKKNLPTFQKRLTHLNTEDGTSIREHKQMAEVLKQHWEPVWTRVDPSPGKTSCYLDRYDKKISEDIPKPSLELVIQVMSKPRRSSTGPDGIPYGIYKALIDIAAPRLFHFILHLSLGKKANRSFNFSNLHFFPKDSTNLPSCLRPISVGNTDNRLIANILRACIAPSILGILDPGQHAFVPGASIDDNIRALNAFFNRPPTEGLDGGSLFHDFKKAYDSTSRAYLLNILKRIGMPMWVTSLVSVLFMNNIAFPILGSRHGVTISMTNGLKQGCPLSPLFFILALDPLLTALRGTAVEAKAFCDDLSLLANDLSQIPSTYPHLEAFYAASGCRPNPKKLFLVTQRPRSQEELCSLGLLPRGTAWAGLQDVPAIKYLGIPTGRQLSLSEVYEPAIKEVLQRVARYAPLRNFYSLQNRVIIANSFLLSTFAYVNNFFLMSRALLLQVESAIAKWVIPARRFKLEHLTAPTRDAGLRQPLRDLFKMNVCSLLARLKEFPATITMPRNTTMLIKDHVYMAYENYCHVLGESPEVGSPFKSLHKKMAADPNGILRSLSEKLDNKEFRLGPSLSMEIATNILSATRMLPSNIPAELRTHCFLLVHNAVPTKLREKWRGHDCTCALCGKGEESLAHLHTECPAARSAITSIVNRSSERKAVEGLLCAYPEDFSFRTPSISSECRMALLVFSLSVWRVRHKFVNLPFRQSHTRQASHAITDLFFSISAAAKKKPYKRSPSVKARARRDFLTTVKALPRRALHVYTDGSAMNNQLNNLGAAGAGYFVCENKYTGPPLYESRYITKGTNNYAELLALFLVLQRLLGLSRALGTGYFPPVYIFIDNLYAINTAQKKWVATSNLSLLREIYPLLAQLRSRTSVTLIWVPGHCNVPGNEIADWLAKQGSKGVSSSTPPPPHILDILMQVPAASSEPDPDPRQDHADGLEVNDLLPPLPALLSSSKPRLPGQALSRRSQRRPPACPILQEIFPGIDFSQHHHPRRRSGRPTLHRNPHYDEHTMISSSEMKARLAPGGCDDITIERPVLTVPTASLELRARQRRLLEERIRQRHFLGPTLLDAYYKDLPHMREFYIDLAKVFIYD